MADVVEPAFVGFGDLVVGLIQEIREAVDRAQLAQNEAACELRAAASLDIEMAQEELVTDEEVGLFLHQLLSESGADVAWSKASGQFLKLVDTRLGLVLVADDHGKDGLTLRGREKIIAAIRRKLAINQLNVVRRLAEEGSSRIKVGSGAISIKLEMRVQAEASTSDTASGKTTAPPRRSEALKTLPAATDQREGLRVLVRPARPDESVRAEAFGKLKIIFVVL